MQPRQFHITALTGAEAFREGMLMCRAALTRLGYEVSAENGVLVSTATNIVFGSYVTSWKALIERAPAANIILYNWEQVGPDVPWFTARYVNQLIHAQVWDYSQRNVAMLRACGATQVQHVPLGYVPELETVPTATHEDIDVLFYGTINPRRQRVLDAIRARGLKLVSTENGPLVGTERDAMIGRAKVVLNMHYYEATRVFEIARVSFLLANGRAVVAELGPDTIIDDDLRDAVAGATLDELPQRCEELVRDADRRHALARRGQHIFRRRDATAILAHALSHDPSKGVSDAPSISAAVRPLPTTLRIGNMASPASDWRIDACNLNEHKDHAPDLHCDIGQPLPFGAQLTTWRFGSVRLQRGAFTLIVAEYVMEQVADLRAAMENCLDLLEEGGVLELEVPYDLSTKAWAGPQHRRGFNEHSWDWYTDGHAKLGWKDARFELINQSFIINNAYGMQMLALCQNNWDEVVRIPRAVDALRVWLRKRRLSDAERAVLQADLAGVQDRT